MNNFKQPTRAEVNERAAREVRNHSAEAYAKWEKADAILHAERTGTTYMSAEAKDRAADYADSDLIAKARDILRRLPKAEWSIEAVNFNHWDSLTNLDAAGKAKLRDARDALIQKHGDSAALVTAGAAPAVSPAQVQLAYWTKHRDESDWHRAKWREAVAAVRAEQG
jgi:hypothetical protein